MSRLESMMRRLAAQKDGLEWAAARVETLAGDALEMGLGNGRSYDHLRQILGTRRRIWVIDRVLQCHPSCRPPAQDFLQGQAAPMLAHLAAQDRRIVLAHYDFGAGVKADDVAEAAHLSPAIARIMHPQGLVVSAQPLVGFRAVAGPASVASGRYFFYHPPRQAP
ncbi:MAG: hypothetical protein GDA40_12015 [Rhodobacteraceae bacterium]|nr:hypothetical protein [Paracoccaceae bacterium]